MEEVEETNARERWSGTQDFPAPTRERPLTFWKDRGLETSKVRVINNSMVPIYAAVRQTSTLNRKCEVGVLQLVRAVASFTRSEEACENGIPIEAGENCELDRLEGSTIVAIRGVDGVPLATQKVMNGMNTFKYSGIHSERDHNASPGTGNASSNQAGTGPPSKSKFSTPVLQVMVLIPVLLSLVWRCVVLRKAWN